MTQLSRRRFLFVSAAASILPRAAMAQPLTVWRGHAFGAHAEINFAGLSPAEAEPLFIRIEEELVRLERIFSLYRSDSALSELNRTGRLISPPPELLELLTIAASLHQDTNGLFDPTVQPLFRLYAETAQPTAQQERAARDLVGFQNLHFDASEIRYGADGMSITLNGIAQGYATDRIRSIIVSAGLTNVVVNIGEIATVGRGPDGNGWPVHVPDGQVRNLNDLAVATSSVTGTFVGSRGHIFRPTGVLSDTLPTTATVIGPSAALADGLSTALAIATPQESAAWSVGNYELIITA